MPYEHSCPCRFLGGTRGGIARVGPRARRRQGLPPSRRPCQCRRSPTPPLTRRSLCRRGHDRRQGQRSHGRRLRRPLGRRQRGGWAADPSAGCQFYGGDGKAHGRDGRAVRRPVGRRAVWGRRGGYGGGVVVWAWPGGRTDGRAIGTRPAGRRRRTGRWRRQCTRQWTCRPRGPTGRRARRPGEECRAASMWACNSQRTIFDSRTNVASSCGDVGRPIV